MLLDLPSGELNPASKLTNTNSLSPPKILPIDLRPFDCPVGVYKEVIRSNRAVTFDDLFALADLGEKNHREYIATSSRGGDQVGSYFLGGYRTSADIPSFRNSSIFFEQWGKINTHNHPIQSETDNGDNIPALALPSGGSTSNEESDFIAHAGHIVDGGALNVVSRHGICLYVGIDDVISSPQNQEIGWTVLSGKRQGLHFLQNTSEVKGGIGNEQITLLDHTDSFGVKRHFVFLSREKVDEIVSKGITYQDLCFNDGLKKLPKSLEISLDNVNELPDNFFSLIRSELNILKKTKK